MGPQPYSFVFLFTLTLFTFVKTILSCIQPTGDLHFGNYFGAVQNWVRLQEEYRCFYGVVDFHAITMPYKPAKLRENTWEITYNLLAAGVEADNLFIQSLIPEHAELGWIMNCFASYGQVTRMTQFKDKSQQSSKASADDFISVGLFDYPVLQAADILIYRAELVPVGKDQDQHLELTRNIAARFNAQVGREYFVPPEALHTDTPRVASTADPTRKMGKSSGPKHHINVFAEEAQIRKQIRSAVTDAGDTPVGELSPGVANLLSMLSAAGESASAKEMREVALSGKLRYGDLKQAVADALVAVSAGMRERKAAVVADRRGVKDQVRASSAAIRKRAQETLREVKELAGLNNPRL